MEEEMDLQKLVDALGEAGKQTRGQYHLTLGRLISALKVSPQDAEVVFDDGTHPGSLDSYRGYYSDLAIENGDSPVTVGELLAKCEAALNATFTGYKGGDFVMGPDTPLWASEYGEASDRAVMGVTTDGSKVVLETQIVQ